MARLFVGWQSCAPGEKTLTYAPEDFECWQPAALTDVVEFAASDLGGDEVDNPFVDDVATGDQFELKEGLFVASWAPGVLQPDEFLYFTNMATGQKYEIW